MYRVQLTFQYDSWVFLRKIFAKLILNVVHPTWLSDKKTFLPRLPKMVLNSNFFFTFLSYCKSLDLHLIPEDFYEKELHQRIAKKSFDNIFNYIIQNSAYKQIGLSMLQWKLCKWNFYFCQQQSSLLYKASWISSIAPLGSEVATAIKCSVSLPDN